MITAHQNCQASSYKPYYPFYGSGFELEEVKENEGTDGLFDLDEGRRPLIWVKVNEITFII